MVEPGNEASLVLALQYQGFDMLLTGDVEGAGEEMLTETLKAEYADTSWEVLKAAHHGSAGSSSERFLRLTSPECAFIGVGAGNSYGHPAQETVGRLADIGAEIYRTDELGSIVLTVRADGTYAIDYIGRA